jgi:hypothetical protein
MKASDYIVAVQSYKVGGIILCAFTASGYNARCQGKRSMSSDVLEVAWSAVLFGEERLAVVELSRRAGRAFGRVGAVEVGDVTVSDIAEPNCCQYVCMEVLVWFDDVPMNLAGIL